MEEIVKKRSPQVVSLIYIMLLFSILLASCNGQIKTNTERESAILSDSITNSPSSSKTQTITQNFEINKVDPLFFIPDQLCQHVREIYQDKRGDLWFGTNVYGLMHYNGDTLEYFSERDGIGGGRITGIVEDKEGNVWFGTYRGLTKYDGESFFNFSKKDGLVNDEIWSLIIDRNNILWLGTANGVIRFDGKEFTTIHIPKADVKNASTVYSYDRITSIIEDRKGSLWFGTDGFGISKFNPNAELNGTDKSFTYITNEDGLPGNNIYDLFEDRNGNIWIGTYFGGVSKYDGKAFTNFTKNGVISGVEVCGFFEDGNGDIWFAAEHFGVYRYKEKSFTNFSQKEGLKSNGILSIYKDREGRFWFGGWGGLFRYDEKSFFSVGKNGPWK